MVHPPPPPAPPKRSATAAVLAAAEAEEDEHRLVLTAPAGGAGPAAACYPPTSQKKQDSTPRPVPDAAMAEEKWTQLADLERRVTDIQDADIMTMLNLFQQAGHYTSQHGPFHTLRDALQRDHVCGPLGEPLPLPPVGNWILAMGVSLLGLDTPDGQELFSRITNYQTAGDLVEAWSLQLWERGYRSLCEQLSGYFLLLHSVLAGIPPRFYAALGQEWRITWAEFQNVMRAWLGDKPAPALLALAPAPAAQVDCSRPARLPELLRARSLSPRDGPLLGSRTDLIDGAADARVFPTILLPYTFPAFQVGSALPLQLQDQPACAYMDARSALSAALLVIRFFFICVAVCAGTLLVSSTLVYGLVPGTQALGHQRTPLPPAALTVHVELGCILAPSGSYVDGFYFCSVWGVSFNVEHVIEMHPG